MKFRSLLAGAVIAGSLALPSVAEAAVAYATGNVNLRAGPGTQYPVATTVAVGAAVEVFGCLSDYSWCDIGYAGIRGWSSGRYLQQAPGRILVPTYARQIGIPVVSFSIGNYWDRYYTGYSFYRDRDRYYGDFGRFDRYDGRWPGVRERNRRIVVERRGDRIERRIRGERRIRDWDSPADYTATGNDENYRNCLAQASRQACQ